MNRPVHRLSGRHRRSDLPVMLTALDEAIEALDGRADRKALARARKVRGRAGERLLLSGQHTVVALAGATGSGPSTRFNALSGAELSPAGVRRPTTAKAYACVWGVEEAAPLVQWLGVPRRQTAWQHGAVVEDQPELDGLVLLDLPDHDSNVLDHRLEVDRLVELVDLLVWVVDPQKYADEALHENYLRRLSGHAAVTVVLLNQVDTLTAIAAAEIATDLGRLVELDGLRRAQVLTCSARTGEGLDDVHTLLASAVTRRQAGNDRLVADVESVVYALALSVSLDANPDVSPGRGELVESLASSAGVQAIGEAVEQSWLRRARTSLGWPPARWSGRLRPDVLRRARLPDSERRGLRAMASSSVPAPAPVQLAQVESAVRRLSDEVSRDLPPAWQKSVRRAAPAEDVRDGLDQAMLGTDLGVDRTPVWWRLGWLAQWLVTLAAVAGGLWLLLVTFGGDLGLSDASTSSGDATLPAVLLVGGVLVGVLLALWGRSIGRAGAAEARGQAESRLRAGVESVADRLVIGPVAAEVQRHERARDALSRAAGE